MIYQVELTEAEDLSLQSVAVSADDWIANVVKERCRIAMDEIINLAVRRYLEEGIQVPATRDDIVIDAFDRGWVVKAKDVVTPPL